MLYHLARPVWGERYYRAPSRPSRSAPKPSAPADAAYTNRRVERRQGGRRIRVTTWLRHWRRRRGCWSSRRLARLGFARGWLSRRSGRDGTAGLARFGLEVDLDLEAAAGGCLERHLHIVVPGQAKTVVDLLLVGWADVDERGGTQQAPVVETCHLCACGLGGESDRRVRGRWRRRRLLGKNFVGDGWGRCRGHEHAGDDDDRRHDGQGNRGPHHARRVQPTARQSQEPRSSLSRAAAAADARSHARAI